MEASHRWAGVELRHLLALEAIAEHGSFHRAAGHLGYTQSAISQQIAALERIIGDQLLERPGGSRPVSLTAPGALVLRHARSLFAQIGAAQADLASLHDGTASPLRVGAFQSVGALVLPAVLARATRRSPPLPIALTQTTSDDELFAGLDAGELDVIFAMRPTPAGPFTVRDLFADAFVALAPRGGPLDDGRRSVALADLAGHPLITAQNCRYLSDLEALLDAYGLLPAIRHRSDDNGTLIGLVAAGEGVAFVPGMVAQATSAAVVPLTIEAPLPPRRIVLAWRADRLLPAARATFADLLSAVCAELGLGAAQPPRPVGVAAA